MLSLFNVLYFLERWNVYERTLQVNTIDDIQARFDMVLQSRTAGRSQQVQQALVQQVR